MSPNFPGEKDWLDGFGVAQGNGLLVLAGGGGRDFLSFLLGVVVLVGLRVSVRSPFVQKIAGLSGAL